MIVKGDSVGELKWIISVDSSVVRAHQHAAAARERGCRPAIQALAVTGEAFGRSRGGLSTKIHVGRRTRLPMRILNTPGRAGDNPQLIPLPDGIRVAVPRTLRRLGLSGSRRASPSFARNRPSWATFHPSVGPGGVIRS
ncbi:hypothetical protein [Saccharothrix obliqua]|uniref:hypothetical protein n=1 Tax=Saccharothrix obliqua TaxID=2861747 RepID=UPI001C5D8E9F|nr:hypothetical protein [Saccharothrix obliqua]MBW4716836.1 hypothetical protein [Saccharothrix obliqua]